MTTNNAIQHPRLGWALAQTYVSKGLGVDAGKLKAVRESLNFDVHYTIESGNNGTRIYYSKLGILALAKLIGTPKATEFAAECVRSASGALVPVSAAPVQEADWNPVGQLLNQDVYDRIQPPYVVGEPEYLEAYPTQSAPISRSESGWDKLAAHVAAQNAGRISSYTVNYTVNHHAQSRPIPSFGMPDRTPTALFYWGSLILILACMILPIAAIGASLRQAPQTTINVGR